MTNASNGLLIDTNLLVYMHDPRDTEKQQTCLLLIEQLFERRLAVFSAQCFSEFYNVVTNKLPERMAPSQALAQIQRFIVSSTVLDVTPAVILEGCRGSAEYQLSVWDALIWAAAKLNQVPFVLTEDAEHGLVREGVRYLNPFSPRFSIQT